MFKPLDTRAARARRHRRIRVSLSGTGARPRLNVFRSLHHIYAQVVSDDTGRTLVAASTMSPTIQEALDPCFYRNIEINSTDIDEQRYLPRTYRA